MSRKRIARQIGHSSTRTLETRYADWITEDTSNGGGPGRQECPQVTEFTNFLLLNPL
jgi:hypothetical protein